MVSYNLEKEQIEHIKQLHEIYIYFKYFYYHICNDIRSSLENMYFKEYVLVEKVILEMINPLELNQLFGYIEILKTKYSMFCYSSLEIQMIILNKKPWYKIIKYEILKLLGKKDKLSLTSKQDSLDQFNFEYFDFYKRYYDVDNQMTHSNYKGVIHSTFFPIMMQFRNNTKFKANVNYYLFKIQNFCLNITLNKTQINEMVEALTIELNE